MSVQIKMAQRFFKILEVISKLSKDEKINLLKRVIAHIERYE